MILFKHYLSNCVYFLLFPFCFIYLVLISLMVMPPFIGGYYSGMAVAIIIPLLLFYLVFTFPEIRQSTLYDALFFVFIFHYSVIVILNYDGAVSQTFINHVATLVYLTSTFLVFRGLRLESKVFYALNAYFFILMSAVVIALTSSGVFLLVVDGAGLANNKASYQFIAVIYVFSYIIFLSRERVWFLRYAFHLLALLVLFLNGARSELIGVLLIIPIYEAVNSKKRLLMVVVNGAFVACLVSVLYLSKDLLGTRNRTVELLVNTAQNASGLYRNNLTNNALGTLSENPLLGAYGSYDAGAYAHNILSVWVDLGVVGFLLYCVLLLIPLFFVTYLILIKNRKSEILIVLMCLIYISVLLAIFAKSISYILPPAAFGLFSNYLSRFKLKAYTFNDRA